MEKYLEYIKPYFGGKKHLISHVKNETHKMNKDKTVL